MDKEKKRTVDEEKEATGETARIQQELENLEAELKELDAVKPPDKPKVTNFPKQSKPAKTAKPAKPAKEQPKREKNLPISANLLRIGERNNILNTLDNYNMIVSSDKFFVGKIRFNLMSGRTMISGVKWDAEEHPIRDNDLRHIRLYLSYAYEGLQNKDLIRDAIELFAYRNRYHPILDRLNSIKWDGVQRLDRLFVRYLGAPDTELTHAITRMLFYGLIQRVNHPGIKFDNCLILCGGQGAGKSSLVRFLALFDEYFTDSLKNMEQLKDAGEVIRGMWVCELAEMIATRKTKDIESIKGFLSKTSDRFRESYAVYAEDYPRQTVFIGTTNRSEFLPDDPTGNRRFFPIVCDASKAEIHPLDNEAETRAYIEKCYAEAICRGEGEGYPLDLEKKYLDELDMIREDATPEDPKVDMIQQYLDMHNHVNYVCTRIIFDEVFNSKDPSKKRIPEKWELTDIAEIMNNKIQGWQRYSKNKQHNKKFRGFANPQRAWERTDFERCKPVINGKHSGKQIDEEAE